MNNIKPFKLGLLIIALFILGLLTYCLGYQKYPCAFLATAILLLIYFAITLTNKPLALRLTEACKNHSKFTFSIFIILFFVFIFLYDYMDPYEKIINAFGYEMRIIDSPG